jgi:hypothetical protein
MSKVLVEVAPGISRWAYDDDGDVVSLASGSQHELDATGDLAAAVAAAVDAGVLALVDGELPKRAAVESQEESEAKYEKAAQARAPLFAERDRALYGVSRQDLSDEDLDDHPDAERSGDGTYDTFRASVDYVHAAAEAGSEYHQVILDYEDKMAQAAQEALEG